MEHSIGGTTHCNIQCHGIQKSITSSNAAWQHAVISFLIVFISILHYQSSRIFKQLSTVGMSRQNSAIPRKPQTNSLIEAIHGISRKHTRTATTARTRIIFNLSHILIADRCISRFNHGVYQIKMLVIPFSCLHRTTRYKNSRYVQPHGSHQHTRSDFVTITDTHHCIRLMSIHHIFHAVGNDITTRQ